MTANCSKMMTNWVSFLSLSLLLVTCITSDEESNPVYQGRYMHSAGFSGGYEIVIPRKVSSDGKFVSYRVPHQFDLSSYEGHSRRKRTPDEALHYLVQIDGTELHLELYPNHRLLAPGAVVEEHTKRNGEEENTSDESFLDNIKFRRANDDQCHYHGRVRNETENSAISTCYGLTGYIRRRGTWYTIEPVSGHDSRKEEGQPHIVYKRSPAEFGTRAEFFCNVTGNLAKTIAKRSLKQQDGLPARERMEGKKPVYTIELLLVLDKTVLEYYRQWDVENYALTLFNMAAGLFHDESLEVEMQLAIVRIIRLEIEDDEMNLSANKDAEKTLKYFQEWQRLINPGDDSHPNHHDCAILLSRVDICVTRNLCGFTGTSTVAGTCDPLMGAVVVKDNGLQTGYHIAHHIGHTLGMSHDSSEENGCSGIIRHRDGFVENTVMHPGEPLFTKSWSKCSRIYLKSYIDVVLVERNCPLLKALCSQNDATEETSNVNVCQQVTLNSTCCNKISGMGFCLEDEPHDHHFPTLTMLPGVMYDGDDQCRLRYRQDVRQCDLGITCESLRCAIPGKGCVSGRKPPAEGTPCGEKRWCYQMKCLMVGERPGARDGGWGSWSPWSRCSRSCGSGVASSVRKCNRPTPSKGGKYCTGDRKRHKICATDPCDVDAPSFRDVQCAEFNDWIFPEDGKVHQWVAYNLPENLKVSENPCALYCLSETKLVTSLRPKVVDGTTCYSGIRDICIGGECKEIPCDLNMDSTAVEDVCGVCKGDSTACTLKEGTIMFEVSSHLKKVVDVPIGSRNIRVDEADPTTSRIAVQNKRTKAMLIDGDRLGMFDVPGSKAWLGMIRARQEALNIPGPVTEDLIILVQPKENVTLKYSLGLKQQTPRKAEFSWGYIDWERCSAACGPGEQIAKARCIEKIGGLVDDSFCASMRRPDVRVRSCNQATCVPRWMISDWQGCTPCVTGCKRTRAVKCVRPVGRGEQDVDIIADNYCQGPKPRESELCGTRRRRRENEFEDTGSDESDIFPLPAVRARENGDDRTMERSQRNADDMSRENWDRSMNPTSTDRAQDLLRIQNDGSAPLELMKNEDLELLRRNAADGMSKEENLIKLRNRAGIRKNNRDFQRQKRKEILWADGDLPAEKLRLRKGSRESANSSGQTNISIKKRGHVGFESMARQSSDSGNFSDFHKAPETDSDKVEHGQWPKQGIGLNENSDSKYKIDKGQMIIDTEDITNLTLTIIVERDEENRILNFPKDFKPQPPDNSTELTLIGMDAVKYIQRIQHEAPSLS